MLLLECVGVNLLLVGVKEVSQEYVKGAPVVVSIMPLLVVPPTLLLVVFVDVAEDVALIEVLVVELVDVVGYEETLVVVSTTLVLVELIDRVG